MPDTANHSTIGQYLLQRLFEAGARHVFGVPGDYILRFYDEITKSGIVHIGTTREDTAAFAADGYAPCQGIGALAVTYGVGALNVVNAMAGAHAESSPVVVISGAPGVREQQEDPLLHHRFGPFTFQREIFDRITSAALPVDGGGRRDRETGRALITPYHQSALRADAGRHLATAARTPHPAGISSRIHARSPPEPACRRCCTPASVSAQTGADRRALRRCSPPRWPS